MYANSISEEENYALKALLLQRLSARWPQQKDTNNEWLVIDLQDNGSKHKAKQQKSAIKQVKELHQFLVSYHHHLSKMEKITVLECLMRIHLGIVN